MKPVIRPSNLAFLYYHFERSSNIATNACIDAIIRKIIFYLLLKISIFALYILYCYSANTTSTFVFKRLKIFSFKLSLLPSAQVCDATKASYLFYSRLHKIPHSLPSKIKKPRTMQSCFICSPFVWCYMVNWFTMPL